MQVEMMHHDGVGGEKNPVSMRIQDLLRMLLHPLPADKMVRDVFSWLSALAAGLNFGCSSSFLVRSSPTVNWMLCD